MSRTGSPEVPIIIDKEINQETNPEVYTFRDPHNLLVPQPELSQLLYTEQEILDDRPGYDQRSIKRTQEMSEEMQERCEQAEKIRINEEEGQRRYKAAMKAVYDMQWGEIPIVNSKRVKKERREKEEFEEIEGAVAAASISALEEIEEQEQKVDIGKAAGIAVATILAGNLLLSACTPAEATKTPTVTIEPTKPAATAFIETEQVQTEEPDATEQIEKERQEIRVYSIDGTGNGSENGNVYELSGIAATPESPQEIEEMIKTATADAKELSLEMVEALAAAGEDIIIGSTYINPGENKSVVYFSDEDGKPLMIGLKRKEEQMVSMVKMLEKVSEQAVVEFENGELIVVDPEKGDNTQAVVANVDENDFLFYKEIFGIETHKFNIKEKEWQGLQILVTETPIVKESNPVNTVEPTATEEVIESTIEPTPTEETIEPTQKPQSEFPLTWEDIFVDPAKEFKLRPTLYFNYYEGDYEGVAFKDWSGTYWKNNTIHHPETHEPLDVPFRPGYYQVAKSRNKPFQGEVVWLDDPQAFLNSLNFPPYPSEDGRGYLSIAICLDGQITLPEGMTNAGEKIDGQIIIAVE